MRLNDKFIGILAMIAGLAVLIRVQFYPNLADGQPGPALFPQVIGGLFIVVGLVLFWQARKSHDPMVARLPELTPRGVGNVLFTIGAIIFYIMASRPLGFLVTSFVIMTTMMVLLKAKIVVSVPVAIGTTICIYAIFNKMLLVPLPRGLLYF